MVNGQQQYDRRRPNGADVVKIGTQPLTGGPRQTILTISRILDDEPFPSERGQQVDVIEVIPEDGEGEPYLEIRPVR